MIKLKEYEEKTKYNAVYFDFETLVQNNNHISYCISYCIAEYDSTESFIPEFSQTKNIYGFDCAIQFREELPENSSNLRWAHNAGFDCRFQMKHLTYKSKNTNMIDQGTTLKQLVGF